MSRKPGSLYDSLRNRSRSSSRTDLATGSNQRAIDDLIKQCYNLNRRITDLEKIVFDLQEKNRQLTTKLNESIGESNNNDKKPVDSVDSLNVIPNEPKVSMWSRLKGNLLNRPTIETLKTKKIYRNEPCFNTDLESVVRDEISGVPKIVSICCSLIEKILFECRFSDDSSCEDLTESSKMISGIYRVPGDSVEIQKLRFKINDNKYECLDRVRDVQTLASLVKLFFFELKMPLIRDLDILKSIEVNPEVFSNLDLQSRVAVMKSFVENLPGIFYETLKFFILHLNRLTCDYDDLISSESLSVSIGPSIIHVERHHENIEDRCKYQELMNDYLFHIIKYSEFIFPRITVMRSTDV